MLTLEYLRHFRVFGYAIFDLVVAFGGIYLLSSFLSKIFLKIRVDIPKCSWIFLTLPIGITTHLLIGKMTPMTKNFLDIHGHYILKILIIGLLIMGLRGIRIARKSENAKGN